MLIRSETPSVLICGILNRRSSDFTEIKSFFLIYLFEKIIQFMGHPANKYFA